MNDLTERLRKRADQIGDLLTDPPQPSPDARLLRLAANEIERLSCDVAYLQEAMEVARMEHSRITDALKDAKKDRDYWKVEAEGDRAKVAFRDKRFAEARDKALQEVVAWHSAKASSFKQHIIPGSKSSTTERSTLAVVFHEGAVEAIRAMKEKP